MPGGQEVQEALGCDSAAKTTGAGAGAGADPLDLTNTRLRQRIGNSFVDGLLMQAGRFDDAGTNVCPCISPMFLAVCRHAGLAAGWYVSRWLGWVAAVRVVQRWLVAMYYPTKLMCHLTT